MDRRVGRRSEDQRGAAGDVAHQTAAAADVLSHHGRDSESNY